MTLYDIELHALDLVLKKGIEPHGGQYTPKVKQRLESKLRDLDRVMKVSKLQRLRSLLYHDTRDDEGK